MSHNRFAKFNSLVSIINKALALFASNFQKKLCYAMMLSSVILLSACGGSGGGGGGDGDGRTVGDDGFTRLVIPEADKVVRAKNLAYSYVANGPYRSQLKDCASRSNENACLLDELPMIYQDVKEPSVSDIMNRVLVTHDWMGLRFQQLLEQMPREALKAFAPVTHIVVGGDGTRTTEYDAYGNVLTIGPRVLWLTADEKLSLFEETDGGGGTTDEMDSLQFDFRYRFMKNDSYALWFESMESRELYQLYGRFQTSLFYSLAFANNISYAAVIDDLPTDISTVEVFDDYYAGLSTELYNQPGVSVGSEILNDLSFSYYEDDVAPTELENTYLPDYVGGLFADDGMPVFYSYRNRWSEVRRLLQLGMLQYFDDIYIDVAFTNPEPDFEVLGCDDARIGWGVRNRLANPAVAGKAKFLMEQVFGQSAKLDNFFANDLGEELPLPVGEGWCDSIRLMSQ
jgi:hypothetical protein